jgi:hypothetical protein
MASLEAAEFPLENVCLEAQQLLGALRSVVAQLSSLLPTSPIEPSTLSVHFDYDSQLSEISEIGLLIDPVGVLAQHVEVRDLPVNARPGRTLQFELALSADYPCIATAELKAAATSLLPHVQVNVSVVCGEVSSLPLLATPALAANGRSVAVTVPIPGNTGADSCVVIHGVYVTGQFVESGQSLPARIAVLIGITAPLRLEGAVNHCNMANPVISHDGTLYAPRYDSPDVLVFSADGAPLPSLLVDCLDLSTTTCSAAFDEASTTLLLAEAFSVRSMLVAVDVASCAVRWSSKLGGSCYGIAVLSRHGIVVAGVFRLNELRVFGLADGSFVATAPVEDPAFMVTDPATSTLYVSTRFAVSSFQWNGGTLVSGGVVKAAGDTDNDRPLAVVPPAPGQRNSYLVVGTADSPTLAVLSLPDCRRVHTHTLDGMDVKGLAAEPTGTALAVCDGSSKAVHVLPWPLPGMPLLQ